MVILIKSLELFQRKHPLVINAIITRELIVIKALIKFPKSLRIYFYLHVRNMTQHDSNVFNYTKRHNFLEQLLTLIHKLLESALSNRVNYTRVKRHTPLKIVITKPRFALREHGVINGVLISMKTFDVTDTVQKNYPGVSDLLTETEFTDYLAKKDLEVSPEQLRQYRHRDKKFCYIKRGNSVFYPKFINEVIVREMKAEDEV